MKIAMIFPNRYWDNTTNYQLGVALLTTILKQGGHDARYFCYYDTRSLKDIKDFDPDVLGYYYLEFQKDLIAEIITEFPTKYHIAGGPYPTLNPKCIDELPLNAIFRGEADRGLLRFIDSGLTNTNIPGFVFKTHSNALDTTLTKTELDALPVVEREPYTSMLLKYDRIKRWDSSAKGALHFTAGRGCPYSCRFCANSVYNKLWGANVRFRNVDSLIYEIRTVCEQYEFGSVVFTDDIMTTDKNWFEQFILQYIVKIKTKFNKTLILNTRIECITPDQMRLLKDANCVLLRAGIESGSSRIRELMGRPMDAEDIFGVFCQMADAGLRTYSYNLLGFPSETAHDWKETFDLNKRIDDYSTKYRHLGMVNVFYPYKGTPAGDECYKNDWVDLEALKTAHPHYDYALKSQPMSKDVIEALRTAWPFNHGG